MIKRNYDREMRDTIKKFNGEQKKLLLHACCGPCSSYPVTELKDIFDITIDFYNPNIESEEEYQKRLKEIQNFLSGREIDIISTNYDHNEFLEVVKGLEDEPEGGKRCLKCFELRLREAAKRAKELGNDYFTTTLTISPLKNSQVLNKLGEKIGEEEGIKFLPSDFKKRDGYKKSVEISNEYQMYRQNYCGCEFSKREI